MKKILLILSLFFCLWTARAQYIPNSATIYLQEVIDGLCTAGAPIDACGTLGTPTCTPECFALADYITANLGDFWDATYEGSHDCLINFRNYGGAECTRPGGLATFVIYRSMRCDSVNWVDIGGTTGSDACDGNYTAVTTPCDVITKTIQAESLTVGKRVYNQEGTDCTTLPNGWYLPFPLDACATAIHIVSGIITETYSCPC